jgi:DNA-directed RNA polymerase specialized sigma24 family protein
MSAAIAHEVEEVCTRWKKDVFAFCRAVLGDGAAAEDATSDAFTVFCREQLNDLIHEGFSKERQ